jgi:hypothetical protein
VGGRYVCGDLDVCDIVSGMTSGHQDTSSVWGLEKRAAEFVNKGNVFLLARCKVDHGSHGVKNLGLRFVHESFALIPSSTFDLHSEAV